MSQSAVCFHCEEPVPLDSHFQLSINQQHADFCCPACLAISETIYAAGLDNYYQSRAQHAHKPEQHDFSHWDNAKLQKEFVDTHDEPIKTAHLYIEGMHCTACAWLIEQHLQKQAAVIEAKISYQEQKLTIRWHDDKLPLSQLMQAINAIGYIPHPYQDSEIYAAQKAQNKKQLTRIGITAILMMQVGMLAIGLYLGDYLGISDQYRQLLKTASLFFSLPILYFSALPFISSAYTGLKQRKINMDFNISLAIIGLYGSSVYSVYSKSGDIYFDSVAMLCLFILIARYIEMRSRQKLYQQQGLLPKTATKVIDEHYQELPLAEIVLGDFILIKPGADIALDGRVVSGYSSISEAAINGESRAINKKIGDEVYAGSQNHDGLLTVEVTATAEHCLINKIAELCNQQESDKSQAQNSVNRIASIFTFSVFLLAIASYVFWFLKGHDEAFWIALSVLVISCPCALSLAAPTALSAVQYRLRHSGLLIRSPEVLPLLNQLTDVIFDKTGTLTHGQIQLQHTHTLSHFNKQELLAIASSLESTSQHPIAKAFNDKSLLAQDCNIFTGLGIEGTVKQQRYRIGSVEFCQQWHSGATPPDTPHMLIGLADKQQMIAWFELSDSIRPEALPLTKYLKKLGLQLHILSGDSSDDVKQTANTLGISNFHKHCSSQDKLDQLNRLQEKGAITMMVGDGINDAPVLRKAQVSVAFFNSSQWLKNNADIILLNNDLSKIQDCLNYAKAYQRVYRQNFGWALLYNAIAIPFAMSGWVTPLIAALGMSFSSIVVVLNSQRLLKKKSD
ncbi:MAG: cadmium-translocating P-type ATPase [Pseudomonadales bacterium]|nr:cadmium-translocating P-type ATPase [Pseudomonadales bacterium]